MVPKPNDAGLDLPTYQHPLGYITQIGDHLLTTLPQQLEPYADTLERPLTSEEKARHNPVTPTVAPTITPDAPFTLKTLPKRSEVSQLASPVLPDPNELGLDGGKQKENGKQGEGEGENREDEGIGGEEEGTVAHQWIAAVSKRAMVLYVKKILEIPQLTPGGAKQLDTDIGYLFKVLSALDVLPDNSLVEIQRFVAVPKEEFAEVVKLSDSTPSSIAFTIGNMRGIKLS